MAFLGLDLGGSHATCALLQQQTLTAAPPLTPDDTSRLAPFLPQITQTLQHLQATATEPVEGLGVGFCGLVDAAANRVRSTNGKFEDIFDLDLEAWAKESFGLPLRLENDARLALRGEMNAGAGQHIGDIVMFTLGTGIGGVAAMGGKPLVGVHGQAGVLAGHVPVRAHGRPCTCGGHGCAEAEASGWALPSVCREWPGFSESSLSVLPLNFRNLFAQAAAGDRVAREVRDHCLNIWGMMTVAAVHAFDPEIIIFGGGVMGSAAEILPVLQQFTDRNTWSPWGKARLVPAALGNDAPFFGVPTLFAKD